PGGAGGMHELSLALEVCRLAEVHLAEAPATSLRNVAVEVGDDANVEVENFRFCLEALLSAPPFGAARPTILRCAGPTLRIAYLEVDDGRPDH
ncbi:MAG: hydrogenase maturation nickel metallochaperone HypA, partial [Gemmatimonadetes bacterium]|nr:hydrogenase maturation nickel metallochaperone HypA [Gemmatimonadota bacterium]